MHWRDFRSLDSKVTVLESNQRMLLNGKREILNEQRLNGRDNGRALLPMYDLLYRHHVVRDREPPSWYTDIPIDEQMFNLDLSEGLDKVQVGAGARWATFTNIRTPSQPMDYQPSNENDDGDDGGDDNR